MAALFGLAELALVVWWIVASSLTLAEAERFSGGRGFATIALTAVAPMLIVIAAILTALF
jgi:hypothetical protein